MRPVSADELQRWGVDSPTSAILAERLRDIAAEPDPVARWTRLAPCLAPDLPARVHQRFFAENYADWDEFVAGPPPMWLPEGREDANVHAMMRRAGVTSVDELSEFARTVPERFWGLLVECLGIPFDREPEGVLTPSNDWRRARWFPGARLNAAAGCHANRTDAIAIRAAREDGGVRDVTHGELDEACGRFAAYLTARGLVPGDRVGLVIPFTVEGVVALLGTIRAGCVAVSIAESFQSAEIARRLEIANVRLVVSTDITMRAGRRIEIASRLDGCEVPAVVVRRGEARLSEGNVDWDAIDWPTPVPPVPRDPNDEANILFSSGTTGEPKAIPWTQATSIKAAADGFLYQDLRAGDVLCWPTSLGWMMGPWVVHAGLTNGATIVAYEGHPATPEFCRLVEDAGVTVLGVVPSLVAAWIESDAWRGRDWTSVRLISSTGECSHPANMVALSARAGWVPVIEYCGGTEIGGGYLSSTVLRPSAPAAFNQTAFDLDVLIDGVPAGTCGVGEVFLRGPSPGLSSSLLNASHDEVYHAGTPVLDGGPVRRHGDAVERLPGGFHRVHGRVDDTMNLGGVKVSAAEIERVLGQHPGVAEVAAVAVRDLRTGAERLVLFVVPSPNADDVPLPALQKMLGSELNPLFRIAEMRTVDALPRTESNKVMRRELRRIALAPNSRE